MEWFAQWGNRALYPETGFPVEWGRPEGEVGTRKRAAWIDTHQPRPPRTDAIDDYRTIALKRARRAALDGIPGDVRHVTNRPGAPVISPEDERARWLLEKRHRDQ